MPPKNMSTAEVQRLVAQQVADAIATYEANRSSGADRNDRTSGDGAGPETVVKACTYKDFLNCKPHNFKGTEGAVGLVRWFEKMESVFRISNCTEACQVKFATCTLQDSALTWWNSYAQAKGIDTAYQLPWGDLKKMMRDEYCPRNEIQQLEVEF